MPKYANKYNRIWKTLCGPFLKKECVDVIIILYWDTLRFTHKQSEDHLSRKDAGLAIVVFLLVMEHTFFFFAWKNFLVPAIHFPWFLQVHGNGKSPYLSCATGSSRPSPPHDAVVENIVTMHHRMQATPQHELEKKTRWRRLTMAVLQWSGRCFHVEKKTIFLVLLSQKKWHGCNLTNLKLQEYGILLQLVHRDSK